MEYMAAHGTLFQNAYTNSPLCSPSRSSFIAGLYPHDTGVYSNCNLLLDESIPAYTADFKKNGVYTVHIGKTHYYTKGANLGFDERLASGDSPVPNDTNIQRDPVVIRDNGIRRASGYGVTEDAFDHDNKKMDAALNWLKTKPKTFLWL